MEERFIDRIRRFAGTIWERKLAVIAILFVLATGAGIAAYVTVHAEPAAPEEIILTAEQQQPLKDMIAEQARVTQQQQDRIAGALKMLMAQTKDPVTGRIGLSETEWVAQNDGKGGVKFITMKAAKELEAKAKAAARAQEAGAPPQ